MPSLWWMPHLESQISNPRCTAFDRTLHLDAESLYLLRGSLEKSRAREEKPRARSGGSSNCRQRQCDRNSCITQMVVYIKAMRTRYTDWAQTASVPGAKTWGNGNCARQNKATTKMMKGYQHQERHTGRTLIIHISRRLLLLTLKQKSNRCNVTNVKWESNRNSICCSHISTWNLT